MINSYYQSCDVTTYYYTIVIRKLLHMTVTQLPLLCTSKYVDNSIIVHVSISPILIQFDIYHNFYVHVCCMWWALYHVKEMNTINCYSDVDGNLQCNIEINVTWHANEKVQKQAISIDRDNGHLILYHTTSIHATLCMSVCLNQ